MRVAVALQAAIRHEKLTDTHPQVIIYDLNPLLHNVTSLLSAFPSDTLHAFALKAAPFPRLLRHLHAHGIGAECASVAELAVAEAADIPAPSVIFDSPAKTDAHLLAALSRGVHINADNADEVLRISRILPTLPEKARAQVSVGLRINPQLGAASIAETFTAAAACKFGEPLKERRREILNAFVEFPFLSGIHVHVGSQGCEVDVLVKGAAAAVELAEEVEKSAGRKVKVIDIGGGLSVNYMGEEEIEFQQLSSELRNACPKLFEFRLMTEFGRRVAAKTAIIATRVQAVKQSGGKTYVICHTGADVLMRPVYQGEKWAHRIDVFDGEGRPKKGEVRRVDVGGPLCFAGDIIAKDREMVLPEEGDYLVVRDCGAYTVSMYCRHTSQLTPAIYAMDSQQQLLLIKGQETVQDVVKFWS